MNKIHIILYIHSTHTYIWITHIPSSQKFRGVKSLACTTITPWWDSRKTTAQNLQPHTLPGQGRPLIETWGADDSCRASRAAQGTGEDSNLEIQVQVLGPDLFLAICRAPEEPTNPSLITLQAWGSLSRLHTVDEDPAQNSDSLRQRHR